MAMKSIAIDSFPRAAVGADALCCFPGLRGAAQGPVAVAWITLANETSGPSKFGDLLCKHVQNLMYLHSQILSM